MLNEGIYKVFRFHEGKRNPAARFVVSEGHLHHLEDYHEALKDLPEGPIDQSVITNLEHLPAPFVCVMEDDFADGKHPHLIPEAELPPFDPAPTESQPLATWAWETSNSGEPPSTLEHKNGKFFRDNQELHEDDLFEMLEALQSGMAKVSLKKDEDDPQQALAHLESAHGHNPESKAAIDFVRRSLYGDSMNPSIGNKLAYKHWLKKPREGVHIAMDMNNFKSLNDTHGHDAGDKALTAFSRAAREAMDETMKPVGGTGKLFHAPHEQSIFRPGGDEFSAWVPSHDHALEFTKRLRDKLDAIPPVEGTHKLSTSIGLGTDPKAADKALYGAKAQKKKWFGLKNKYQPHNIPSVLLHYEGIKSSEPFQKSEENEISQQLKHPDYYVREAAVRHPKATPEHINQGLNDEYSFVRYTAVQHPKATVEHLTQGLKDKDWYVRIAAVGHPNTTVEHINQGLKDDSPDVRVAAVRHPKATVEHLTQGLKDNHPYVRAAAVSHPKATLEHLTQGLKDNHPYVRAAAVSHPNATTEHINQGLKDDSPDVRIAAVGHPKATLEHLTQGLKDKFPYVRAAALSHPNATVEHISQGLRDNDPSVREAAQKALFSKDLNYEQLKALPPKLRNQLFKRKPHSKQFFEQEQRKEQEYVKEQKRQQKLDQTSRWSQLEIKDPRRKKVKLPEEPGPSRTSLLEVDDKDQLPKLTQTLTSRPIQNRNIFQRLREIHEENKRQQKLKPSRTSLLEVDDSEPTDLPKDPDESKRFSLLELSEKELFKQKLKK